MFKNAIPRWVTLICCCAVLLVGAVSVASGQTIYGRISGTVTDPNGAVLPNARVTVTNEATNFARTVNTDDSGYYVVTNLPVGTYTILVEQTGF